MGSTAGSPSPVRLRGVIAAITTPITDAGEPHTGLFVGRAKALLAQGCDGLNVLGTTGEATSLSVRQRRTVMEAAADALPRERLMVGAGAAALADAIELTRAAADLGFAGALLLPPFYYKGVPDEGVARYVEAVAAATAEQAIPIYLYNFPALTGVTYSPDLVARLVESLGDRLAGLKDSSGDLDYARAVAAVSRRLDVFPSNEANLPQARDGGPFAGCISATANLNAADCAKAYRDGDSAALARAVAVRGIFEGLPLVPGVKYLVRHLEGDAAHGRTLPPLPPLTAAEAGLVKARWMATADRALAQAVRSPA